MTDANDYSRFDNLSDSDEDAPAVTKGSVTASERLQQIGTAKQAGNELIGKGEFKAAGAQYRKGLKVVEDLAKAKGGLAEANPAQLLESKELELSLQLNLAMAEIKLLNWASAKKAAGAAVAIDPSNVKALFRRGTAEARSGCFDEAEADLNKCLELDPGNGAAKKELALVKKKAAEAKKQEKAGFGGMFGKKGGAGFYDDLEAARAAKAKAQATAEAARRAAWEADMATAQAAHDACHASEELKKAGESGSHAATDSDDEDSAAPFVRTPFDDWCKAQDAAEKAALESVQAEKAAASARAAAEKKAALKATRAAEAAAEAASELELDEEDAALVAEVSSKGYCHFRHQPTEEEAALIGNIAPQKLDPNDDAPATIANHATGSGQPQRMDPLGHSNGKGVSAWNASGTTWEEKDCSAWAQGALAKYLKTAHAAAGVDSDEGLTKSPEAVVRALDGLDMHAATPAEQASKLGLLAAALAKVTVAAKKVNKVEGDASVAVVRGSKRYLFDLSAQVEYEVRVDESFGMDANDGTPARQAVYKGTMHLGDLTWDQSSVEVSFKPKGKVAASHAARVDAVLQGLKRDTLQRCVAAFATEFQTSH